MVYKPRADKPFCPHFIQKTYKVKFHAIMNIQKLHISDERFPELLRQIYDSPSVLYYVGDLGILERPRAAIVGTRRMSAYGEAQAFKFGRELSERGICVVSGLAYGIDKAAHEGALEGPGGTIAVIAQGLPDIQPAAHIELARRIVRSGGLILSEQEAGVQTYKSHYLVRNRIIAGLCKATLVVEAPFKSGAMNTVKHALDNGREVLCIPGRIGEEACEGTNMLLQNGAHVALQPRDVADVLKVKWMARQVVLEGTAAKVFEELRKAPRSPAELGEKFERVAELYEALGELELRGLIRFTKELRYAVVSG